MISHKIDVRGTVIDKSWEGKCQEPGDECPTNCQTDSDFMIQTCYACNIPASCEGQRGSHCLPTHTRVNS